MKTRQAFVANSSSSSFIIVYNELSWDEEESLKNGVIPETLKGKKLRCYPKHLCEGYDEVVATKEIIEFIATHKLKSYYTEFDWLEIVDVVGEDDCKVSEKYLGCKIRAIEVDYHTTGSSVDQLIRNYEWEEDYEIAPSVRRKQLQF